MLAGSTNSIAHLDSTVATPPVSTAEPQRAVQRAGIVWIAGTATSVARAGLVDLVRARLEPARPVEQVADTQVPDWIDSLADDDSRAAVVVTTEANAATSRARARAAGVTFTEIRVVSDWDALVERSESRIFERVAAFFTHAPQARREISTPDTVVQVDWHRPSQIEARVTDALKRAGLVAESRSSSFWHP